MKVDDLYDDVVEAVVAAAAASVDVDVPREWQRLQAALEGDVRAPEPRSSTGRRLLVVTAAVAAAVVVISLLAGMRPTEIPTTTARFVEDVVDVFAPPPEDAGGDSAHGPIPADDEYRQAVRRVHHQINDAIGYGHRNYDALDGSDELLESLLGVRPHHDRQLQDAIALLRRAQEAHDRDAASRAHTIIETLERDLAAEGR